MDFQLHVDTLRQPLDTYAMWGAVTLMLEGWCSGDSFWYFQPWLMGQGRRWYEHAALGPDNLADLPAVRALAGRRCREWDKAEWPGWETLAYTGRQADLLVIPAPIFVMLRAATPRNQESDAGIDEFPYFKHLRTVSLYPWRHACTEIE